MYKEVVRWSTCGQSEVEQEISKIVSIGDTKKVKGTQINEILSLKNKKSVGEAIMFVANPKEEYLLYYNYHSSSGYKTIFDEHGQANIISPKGIALSAFFSEVVILEETGKIIEFKR